MNKNKKVLPTMEGRIREKALKFIAIFAIVTVILKFICKQFYFLDCLANFIYIALPVWFSLKAIFVLINLLRGLSSDRPWEDFIVYLSMASILAFSYIFI